MNYILSLKILAWIVFTLSSIGLVVAFLAHADAASKAIFEHQKNAVVANFNKVCARRIFWVFLSAIVLIGLYF